MSSSNLYVYVLTHCPHLKNLYGTTLVFKTLRTGFPTAAVHIVDNCSILQARPILEAAAKECDAFYTQLDDNKLDHYEFISETLRAQAGGASVFGSSVSSMIVLQGIHYPENAATINSATELRGNCS